MSRLAQQGLLDYPMFGLSLTRNTTGTLSLGEDFKLLEVLIALLNI